MFLLRLLFIIINIKNVVSVKRERERKSLALQKIGSEKEEKPKNSQVKQALISHLKLKKKFVDDRRLSVCLSVCLIL